MILISHLRFPQACDEHSGSGNQTACHAQCHASDGAWMSLKLNQTRYVLYLLFVLSLSRVNGGAVASGLVRSSLDRAVCVQALPGYIVLCSWVKHFTLTVPLSTQVYKWVALNFMLRGKPVMD